MGSGKTAARKTRSTSSYSPHNNSIEVDPCRCSLTQCNWPRFNTRDDDGCDPRWSIDISSSQVSTNHYVSHFRDDNALSDCVSDYLYAGLFGWES